MYNASPSPKTTNLSSIAKVIDNLATSPVPGVNVVNVASSPLTVAVNEETTAC